MFLLEINQNSNVIEIRKKVIDYNTVLTQDLMQTGEIFEVANQPFSKPFFFTILLIFLFICMLPK